MAGHEISLIKADDGSVTGIELTVRDDDGTERSVMFEPTDEGDVGIGGRGPSGEKSGAQIDPSGNGDHPLGR